MVDAVEEVVQQLIDRVSSCYEFSEQETDGDVKEIVHELRDHTSFLEEPSSLQALKKAILPKHELAFCCMCYTCKEVKLDFYSLDYRKAPSLASASSVGGSELGDLSDSELPFLGSEEDSDKEFERLQQFTYETRNHIFKREHSDGIPPQKEPKPEYRLNTSDLHHEYDSLPPLEKLTIHCEETVPLELVGRVTYVVDCLVVIQSENGVALDFDSVLFNEDRNSIGVVFDLFGPVKNPLYSIRFNTKEEASKVNVGMQVYYAPNVERYTKTVVETKERELASDDEGSLDDDAKFSDDEKEKEYKARKMKGIPCSETRGRQERKHSVRFSDSIHKWKGGRSEIKRGGIGGESWNWHSVANRIERGRLNRRRSNRRAELNRIPSTSTTMSNPYADYGCFNSTPFVDTRKL